VTKRVGAAGWIEGDLSPRLLFDDLQVGPRFTSVSRWQGAVRAGDEVGEHRPGCSVHALRIELRREPLDLISIQDTVLLPAYRDPPDE
jgi:hypothetical protein